LNYDAWDEMMGYDGWWRPKIIVLSSFHKALFSRPGEPGMSRQPVLPEVHRPGILGWHYFFVLSPVSPSRRTSARTKQ
jgi:hypothetical protein